jgi:DNA-binding transcriptional MerR regulator
MTCQKLFKLNYLIDHLFVSSSSDKSISSEKSDQDLGLTVAAVARRLGVAPATLRTWDRRYGLGPTEHNAGDHRRYSREDLARLTYMRRLVIAGVTPFDAAKRALSQTPQISPALIEQDRMIREDLIEVLWRATQSFDDLYIETVIRKELNSSGVVTTWEQVLIPLLALAGDDLEQSEKNRNALIAAEHFIVDIVRRMFIEQQLKLKEAINDRPVLLASVSRERHTLPLSLAAAALAEKKIRCQSLGAEAPVEVIAEVFRKVAPPAIFVWAQIPENVDDNFIEKLPVLRPAPRIVLAGPGWLGRDIPKTVMCEDIASCLEEITQSVGA